MIVKENGGLGDGSMLDSSFRFTLAIDLKGEGSRGGLFQLI